MNKNLNKMRLSPVLIGVVAIAASIGSDLSVNAQIPNNLAKTITKNSKNVVIPISWAAKLGVVELDSKALKTVQTITPNISPGGPDQTTPFPSSNPVTTPVPSYPQQTTPIPSLPNNVQQQNPFPNTNTTPNPPSGNQQITPPRTPGIPENTTPGQQQFNQPGTQTFPNNGNTTQPNQPEESRVLVSEVLVRAPNGQLPADLENDVYKVIRTQPGRTTTRSQLQEDINSIFGTGFFSNVQAVPEDTPLGVRVSFIVQPNPILTKVQVDANPGTNVPSALPPGTVDSIFRSEYGQILNLRDFQDNIKLLLKQYQDKGYVLANVIGAPRVSPNGVVTLEIAEGVVENIQIRFRNKQGQETDSKGRPIKGRTQPYIVKRELQLRPGQIFNRNLVQKDLQRVYGLGLFEDVNVSLNPGSDPSKVDVLVNVVERSSGNIGLGGGVSSSTGLFGDISYQEQNFNGRNQKLGAEVQLGTQAFLFDLRFTDPWIAGDPYRTSYTADVFRRESISLIFEGKNNNVDTYDPKNPTTVGDVPRIVRTGGGINFTRPLSKNPYQDSEWLASAGFQYQHVTTNDSNGNNRTLGTIFTNNIAGRLIPLSQSGTGSDDLFLLQLGLSRDRRNNVLEPTKGSFFRIGADQSIPIGSGNILLTRLQGSYSQYFPVRLTKFTKKTEALAFNIQGGTVIGDLPPYEAFTLGGSNSVRGYDEAGLASSRTYVQATAEYRFPIFSVISGATFFDFGSDLGTGTQASRLLSKQGTGYSYGLGLRVQSPLGPIRIDYGINEQGGSNFGFGIGEKF